MNCRANIFFFVAWFLKFCSQALFHSATFKSKLSNAWSVRNNTMYVKLCFSEMAANASDIVSADFAEILFSRNCLNYHDGDDNIE